MPSPVAFKKAFNVMKGADIGGKAVVEAIKIGHDVVKQFEVYEFPMEVKLKCDDDIDLVDLLAKYTAESRIVYSQYGTPYECIFAKGKIRLVRGVIKCTGVGTRRYDLPSLKDEDKERKKREREEEKQHDLSDVRVITSRFGTSKCGHCDGIIEIGTRICQKKGEKKWVHVTCHIKKMGSGRKKARKK